MALDALHDNHSRDLLQNAVQDWASQARAHSAARIRAEQMFLDRQQRSVAQAFLTWAAYVRAMTASVDPSSPFAQPRSTELDKQAYYRLAALTNGALKLSPDAGDASPGGLRMQQVQGLVCHASSPGRSTPSPKRRWHVGGEQTKGTQLYSGLSSSWGSFMSQSTWSEYSSREGSELTPRLWESGAAQL